MHLVEQIQLLAELENEHCHLNHGPDTLDTDFPAIDYLVLPVGYKETDHTEVIVREIVIPVCLECVQGLSGNDWTLFYCLDCNSSQWVYRKLARFPYRHHVLWLKGCPRCAERLAALYFNDYPKVEDEAVLLSREIKARAA
ncbi:MAG: hypothetical protein AB1568_07175 [Thermodesulfobacteriota bacterium]